MLGVGEDLGQALEVGFDQGAVLRLVQGRRRVKHGYDQAAIHCARLAMDARDLLARHEERHRETPQRNDHGGVDRLDLAEQVVLGAGGDLVGLRVAVLGRATLHHVADEDLAALETGHAEQLVEKLARWPNKRAALPILVVAGALADQHDLRVGRALAWDGLGAPSMQPTQRAALCLLGD